MYTVANIAFTAIWSQVKKLWNAVNKKILLKNEKEKRSQKYNKLYYTNKINVKGKKFFPSTCLYLFYKCIRLIKKIKVF